MSSATVLVGVVMLTTASAVSGVGPSMAALSFSPSRLAEGRVWLLLSSALVVDRPVLLSLLSFAALALVTVRVCGPRVFWWAACYGHVGSTLIVYALIGVARAFDRGSFGSALNAHDFGVSAISSAWLGATATEMWTLRTGRRPRAAIAIGCCAIGVFAYMVRRDVSVLSTEHFVAFALGVAVALPGGAAAGMGRRAAALRRIPFLRQPRRDFDLLTRL